MAEALPYLEGSVFSVPLREGGYARGIVARAAPEGVTLFGYFFGPKCASVAELNMEDTQPENAIFSVVFGDLGLMNGEWEIIGQLPNWQRDQWAMPDFVRRDPIGKKAWRVRYSDDDPSAIESEERTDFDTNLPDNDSWGHGAVELKLTKLLSFANHH